MVSAEDSEDGDEEWYKLKNKHTTIIPWDDSSAERKRLLLSSSSREPPERNAQRRWGHTFSAALGSDSPKLLKKAKIISPYLSL
jgi:hypothetical protein